ncbi:MAG: hypothetical protein ACT4TC_00075, partial [Myxococcaceae bacterium]
MAHAWNDGQKVSYWREEPLEVDSVLEGSWGSWAVEIKTGSFRLGFRRLGSKFSWPARGALGASRMFTQVIDTAGWIQNIQVGK